MSGLGVMRLATFRSPSSKIPSTIETSALSKTPCSVPSSSMILISSSVTGGGSDSRIPMRRRKSSVDRLKRKTTGEAMVERIDIGRATRAAIDSALERAIRFGTSSPKTSVR